MDTYEKKYKEALERASKLRVQNPFDTVSQMMEHVFPELKESEDERIRRAIIELVRQSSEVLDEQNQNNMVAWLNKQGEQPQGKSALEAVREEKVDNQKMINKIIKEVADLVTANTIFCTKEVLTSDEAARYLGMSKSYLYKLTMKKEIPHFKPLGKMCYFNRQELEAWLQSNRVAMDVKHLTK